MSRVCQTYTATVQRMCLPSFFQMHCKHATRTNLANHICVCPQIQLSRAGVEGTVEYCAPEVLRGQPFSEKADVWSFGVVLWEMLERRRPYADAEVPHFVLMLQVRAAAVL